jgi:hypothetical protein
MKIKLLILVSIATVKVFGQGFPNTPINWPAPDGGKISGATYFGFNSLSGVASSFDNAGSQTWALVDMNGDGRSDLVVAAQMQGGDLTCFSPGLNQYWKVYFSNSSGFSTAAVNWNIPNGGRISGGKIYGFDNVAGTASPSDGAGSQSWALMDVTGDNKPDLIITAQLQAGQVTCFSPGSGQYWKVFVNVGNGFSNTAINWNLPNGGKLSGGTTFGYNAIGGTASSSDNTGGQTWSLADMDGDNKPDLVVTAQLQAGQVTCFSPGSVQYWKIFTNTGNGFNTTSANWNLPNGGKLSGGTTFGFTGLGGSASSVDNTGSQTWSVMDMDGDNKPDLVITAQLQAGAVSCFSPGSSQYWKVYLNSGSGFIVNALNWNLPNGGSLSGGTTFGYNGAGGVANSSDNTGSQSWSLVDMDGDNKLDLVVTAQLQAGIVSCFSPGSNQYWKVFSSYGAGFNTIPVNCSLPNGGKISNGNTFGYNSIGGAAFSGENTGSQSWSLGDLNNDGKPDLIVTAQMQSNNVTSFSPTSSQYWKVFFSDLVLGIKQTNSKALNFVAYPNPNNGSFSLQGNEKETVNVFDELGQIVKKVELNDENNFTATISDLKNGVYILAGKNTTSKIIVLK